MEVAIVVMGLAAADPGAVMINRGNHEDIGICQNYGFVGEIVEKYGDKKNKNKNAGLIVNLFAELFALLPLGTVIDDDIFVVHGGIGDDVTIADMETVDRYQYRILMEGVPEGGDPKDFNTVSVPLWSDPLDVGDDGKAFTGCVENTNRGCGKLFGPDISSMWLEREGLVSHDSFLFGLDHSPNGHAVTCQSLMVRSHECVDEGFEILHGGRVVTLFSASNYYEEGSNKAAYLRIEESGAYFQQFVTSENDGAGSVKFNASVRKMEKSAADQLKHLLFANKSVLTPAFQAVDPEGTGMIRLRDWVGILEIEIKVQVNWRQLSESLVKTVEGDPASVYWKSCLEAPTGGEVHASAANGLYQNLKQMEAVFRRLDVDGSGTLSKAELVEAFMILAKAGGGSSMTEADVMDIAQQMDKDGDDSISLTEFLEALRDLGLC